MIKNISNIWKYVFAFQLKPFLQEDEAQSIKSKMETVKENTRPQKAHMEECKCKLTAAEQECQAVKDRIHQLEEGLGPIKVLSMCWSHSLENKSRKD